MNIHEYQAKAVLREFGVPVPRGLPAMSVEEAVKAATELGGSVWVVKGWSPAGELKRDGAWTPKELADNKSKLFANHSPGIPPFAF